MIPTSAESVSTPAVLVTDVHAMGMIGVVRSLGRAGYRVHACSSRRQALGLHSAWTGQAVVCPPYGTQAFIPWLRDYVARCGIRAIVPSESFLMELRPAFAEFEALLPLSPGAGTVYRCLSKCDVFEAFERDADERVKHNLAPFRVLREGSAALTPEDIRELGTPVWVKGDAVWSRVTPATGAVVRVDDPAQLNTRVQELLQRYERVLVQGHVSIPIQTGVNLLLDGDQVVAESMMLSHRDSPHTGGLTAVRETWWQQEMRDDALRRLKSLGWRGVAMLEYKWDPASGRFYFIELNARFWAALHLDLYAGVDYPKLLMERFLRTGAQHPTIRARLGVISRMTVPADVGHTLSKMRDPAVPILGRLCAAAGFFARFFDPRVADDLRYGNDSGLYWRQWREFAGSIGRGPRP